jgi:hypothetical protein
MKRGIVKTSEADESAVIGINLRKASEQKDSWK